jgi:hypothetical protein
MKKFVSLLSLFIFLSVSTNGITAKASYNYDHWGNTLESAPGINFKKVITAQDLGINIGELKDVYTYDNTIYILDSKLNRLLVIDATYQLLDVLPHADADDKVKLNTPNGVFVNHNGIYIADTNNQRILHVDYDFNFIEEFTKPQDYTFNDFDFKPLKIAVDRFNRIYCVVDQIFEGIVELEANGEFSRYVGVNKVSISAIEQLWLRFTSEEQRKKMSMYLPTAFNNIFIDEENYVYATSSPKNSQLSSVQKINPKGKNILKTTKFGDIKFINDSADSFFGPSEFIDVAVTKDGTFSILDKVKGRIFTYNDDGDLLYIGGQNGEQKNMFKSVTSFTYFGTDLIICDGLNKNFIVYGLTEFGELVTEANHYYYIGDYEQASQVWEKVLELNSNYLIAYNGIGKSLLREGKYKESMEYFKLSNDTYNYSQAFKEYRNDILENVLIYILIVAMAGIAYFIFASVRSSMKNIEKDGNGGELR